MIKSKKSILVIPPSALSPSKHKIRERELAEHLSEFYQVYYLSWTVPEERDIFSRFKALWHDLNRKEKVYRENKLHIVELTMLRRPLFAARHFNQIQTTRLIQRLNPDYVLSGSTFLHPVVTDRRIIYCYDFYDIPTSEMDSFWIRRLINSFVRNEVKKADLVTAVSHNLAEVVEKTYRKSVHYLPNGTSLSKFQSVLQKEICNLKNIYNLQNKFVIGYIGNFGKWSGLDFAIKVFQRFKQEIKNAVLFIVGPGEDVERYKRKYLKDGIVFTGIVDRNDIYKYFQCIDIGILTSPLIGFRDYSFPIKVIEYSAARKIVVSTPVAELRQIKLPNVLLTEYGSVDEWVTALMKARELIWNSSWDQVIEEYDWRTISQKLVELFESCSGGKTVQRSDMVLSGGYGRE